jgi:hypothetical protein
MLEAGDKAQSTGNRGAGFVACQPEAKLTVGARSCAEGNHGGDFIAKSRGHLAAGQYCVASASSWECGGFVSDGEGSVMLLGGGCRNRHNNEVSGMAA